MFDLELVHFISQYILYQELTSYFLCCRSNCLANIISIIPIIINLIRSRCEARDCPVCTIQIHKGFSVIACSYQQQLILGRQVHVVMNK